MGWSRLLRTASPHHLGQYLALLDGTLFEMDTSYSGKTEHRSMKTTAVIIDDEEHCRTALSGILERHHPHVELLGMAFNVSEGIILVNEKKPKILFLDIAMGEQSGFDLLPAIGPDRPHVIFTTAHEGYAVKAIRFSALDHLLKPVDPDELSSAVGKATAASRAPQSPDQFKALLKNIGRSNGQDRRIALPVPEGVEMVNVDEILYCGGKSDRTVVQQREKKPLVIDRTLKAFEDMLDPAQFIRVHDSHLINVKHVKKYIPGEAGEVIMVDGTSVAVSRRKKQELMDSLARL